MHLRKTNIALFSMLILTMALAFLSSFDKSDLPVHIIHGELLLQDSDLLIETAKAFNSKKISVDSLRTVIAGTRESYKRIEFLLNYYYPDYVEGHINGAPLLHIKRDGSRASVVPPEGLQLLDEMIYSDDAQEQSYAIFQETQRFKNNLNVLWKDVKNLRPTKTDVRKAMRLQVVAIFSLGITGFDTPGSASGLSESAEAFNALGTAANTYLEELGLGTDIEAARQYLIANNDFESFDRLEFLKSHLDPIYAKLAIKEGNADPEDEALNPAGTGIFDRNFLNPYYYTALQEKDDSPALRALGEQLFYDPLLSFNSSMSCANCHNPEMAFTDGKKKSLSNTEGKTVSRNAPTLLNAVYADRYFYDLRAFTLEQQAEHVIFNDLEFNTDYSDISDRIASVPEYKLNLKKAFGDTGINRDRLTKALTSYVLSLQSFNSPFDQYVRGELLQIDVKVKDGFNLFMGKAACGTCHFAPTFAGLVPPHFQKSESEILGVLAEAGDPKSGLDTDVGRNENGLANEQAWIYNRSFKTSTVRNIALTAPYFHNGQYASLEAVMDFYNQGGGAGYGLEVPNQTLSDAALDLSQTEIENLIAFMNALTDNAVGEKTQLRSTR